MMSLSLLRPQGIPRLIGHLQQYNARARQSIGALCFSSSRPATASDFKDKMKILSRSTVLMQDGLHIQELPVLVKIVGNGDDPLGTASTPGEIPRPNEETLKFETRLQECTSVYQILQMLEVKEDTLNARSATVALQKFMCLLKVAEETVAEQLKKDILKELCDVICNDIKSLDSELLTLLVQLFPALPPFIERRHIDSVDAEVERRTVDSVFSISELCKLVQSFHHPFWKDYTTKQNMFIQIGYLQQSINHFNMRLVFSTMKYADPSFKHMWRILSRKAGKYWWKLNGIDVATICKVLISENHFDIQLLGHINTWFHYHSNVVKEAEMKDIIAAFSFFRYHDKRFVSKLESYLTLKIDTMSKSLTTIIVDYLLKLRICSPLVLDAVASDFQKNYALYTPKEMFLAIRPFGQLHYIPKYQAKLFSVVEHYLASTFHQFDDGDMIELLTSFVFIDRYPINFIKHVFSSHIVSRVQQIQSESRKEHVMQNLVLLQYAMNSRVPNLTKPYWTTVYMGVHKPVHKNRENEFIYHCHQLLRAMYPSSHLMCSYFIKDTPYKIEILLLMLQRPELLKMAVLCVLPEDYCVNEKRLLGHMQMKKTHLDKLGYNVLLVDYETFSWKCRAKHAKQAYLELLLKPILENYSPIDPPIIAETDVN